MRRAAVSVDLDSLVHYCRIHSMDEAILDAKARRLVYEVAVPRLAELFKSVGLPATYFAIGEELAEPANAQALAAACRGGSEAESHSHRHLYALSRLPAADIRTELRKSAEAIAHATGRRPQGFRAPGYTLSADLYRALALENFAWDSSVFPAVPYYLAKAAALTAIAATGGRSASILDRPAVLRAPRQPYLADPAEPYRRGQGTVLELPISVTPTLRLPFIGTFLLMAPWPLVSASYRALRAEPLLNLELHAVDVLGPEDGVPAPLVRRQRDLALPASVKMERLATVLRWLVRDGACMTLSQAAHELRPLVG